MIGTQLPPELPRVRRRRARQSLLHPRQTFMPSHYSGRPLHHW